MHSTRLSVAGTLRAAAFAHAVLLFIASAGIAVHAQTYTDIYNFGAHANDPHYLDGFLAQGLDGAMYGTSTEGGKFHQGTVFRISPAGRYQILYSFDGTLGTCHSGLTLGADGNFYGTTDGADSGDPPYGTVFRVTPQGVLTVLHTFLNQTDAGYPHAPPVQGRDGNFYGTTGYGGPLNFGTVYRIAPSGKLTTIYQFDSVHGAYPEAPLVQASDGTFYGVAMSGGAYNHGTAFRITAQGKLKVLYNFDMLHGAEPFGPLFENNDGELYGTTLNSNQHGVAFRITSRGILNLLHNFNGSSDGSDVYAGLVQGSDGRFYGASYDGGSMGYGTLFKVSRIGGFAVLYSFDNLGGANGLMTPFLHTNGLLYGSAYVGGTYDYGTFYSLDAGLAPFVSLVSRFGRVGKTIAILGQGFNGTSDVSFNGTPATFTVVSDTYLKALVPSGATKGPVTVTTANGVLTSNKNFVVTP